MKSCLLCGVGGQGTILASRIIATAAMNKGLFARTAETIGMAQRGGVVVSHVRVGAEVPSPLIPPGMADVLLGFEPGEAVRSLGYLKTDGIVIVCDREVQPVTAALANADYSGADMLAYLKAQVKRCYVLRAESVLRECGSLKAMNIALAGAMAQSDAMGLSPEDLERAMLEKVNPKYAEMNRKALRLGASVIQEAKL